jgi:transposase
MPIQRVVFEPTGPYHRAFERDLGAAGVPFVKVNPRQARHFAEAIALHDGKLKRLGRVDMRDSIPRSVISVHNSSKASTPGRRSKSAA